MRKRRKLLINRIYRMEYDREMINGKINEINKSFADQIQSQGEAITTQMKEFEKKLVSKLKYENLVDRRIVCDQELEKSRKLDG